MLTELYELMIRDATFFPYAIAELNLKGPLSLVKMSKKAVCDLN